MQEEAQNHLRGFRGSEGNLGCKFTEFEDVQVFQFSIQNGWDFRRRRLRQEFMEWVRRMRPEDLHGTSLWPVREQGHGGEGLLRLRKESRSASWHFADKSTWSNIRMGATAP